MAAAVSRPSDRRRRALLLTALVLAFVASLTSVARLAPVADAATTTAPVGSTRPVVVSASCSLAAPRTTAGFQAMFDAKNDSGWSGGDQAASFPLPDGRTLWLFDDTVQGTQARSGGYAPAVRMVHNSFLLQDRGCLKAVNGTSGKEVVPDAVNGDYFWPLAATLEGTHLLVTTARVRRTGAGPMDFAGAGTEVAVFTMPRAGTPRFLRMAPLPSTGLTEDRPQYGQALVVAGRYTYVYASRRERGQLVFGKSVTVARVPLGHFLDLRRWTYWDGRGWTTRQAAAVKLVAAAAGGWSTSFSVLRRPHGTFQYVTKADDFLGTTVISGTSTSPQGAFSRTDVATYPSREGELLYNPLAHPEQRLADGRLLVSICRNATDFSVSAANADLYKPQFFSVPAL